MFSTALENNSMYLTFGKVAILGSLLLFMYSCMNSQSDVVCKVGGHTLDEDQLSMLMDFHRNDYSNENLKDKVIEEWVERKLIEIKASNEIPDVYKENVIKSEHEASNLHLFELENHFIRTHIDSTVTDDEIQNYYKEHRENYKTSSYIVKALYIKTPDTLALEGAIQQAFLLKNDKDLNEVKKYGNLYASNFYLGENKWIHFDDLVKEVPMSRQQKETLIRGRGEATFQIDGFTYFINVLDYRSKTISSPMEVEKSIIRAHILKRRVHQLREEAKETILKDVKENYPVSYY